MVWDSEWHVWYRCFILWRMWTIFIWLGYSIDAWTWNVLRNEKPTNKNNNGNWLSDSMGFLAHFPLCACAQFMIINSYVTIQILNTFYFIWQIAHTCLLIGFVIWSKYIKTMSMDIFLSAVINCVNLVLNCVNWTPPWSISIDRWASNAVTFLLLFGAPRITKPKPNWIFKTVQEKKKIPKMNYTLSRILGKSVILFVKRKQKYVA